MIEAIIAKITWFDDGSMAVLPPNDINDPQADKLGLYISESLPNQIDKLGLSVFTKTKLFIYYNNNLYHIDLKHDTIGGMVVVNQIDDKSGIMNNIDNICILE